MENFRKIQDVCESDSGRKNLKRKIEGKTDMFRFLKTGKELLIYPTSLTMDDLVLEYYESVKMIQKLQSMDDAEKSVKNTAMIIRKDIKMMTYKMEWPPKADDLKVENFTLPTHLDSFLTNLLSTNTDVITDRVARLKLSFGQDLTYAGNIKNFMFSCRSLSFLATSCTVIYHFSFTVSFAMLTLVSVGFS